MRGKITKRSVDALKPAADGAEAVLWDSELKGFGVRVQRGGAKSYVLHYRAGTGRGAPLRKLTIGRHGSPWTPETARKEAKTLLGMIEDGADPAADKMARREAPTIAELAERFLAEHAEAKRKGSTAAEYQPAARQDHPAGARQAEGGRRHPRRHDQAAPCEPGGALPGEPRARGAVQDVQPRRALGLAAGRIEPLPPCREIRRAQARAHAVAGRAGAARRRARGP